MMRSFSSNKERLVGVVGLFFFLALGIRRLFVFAGALMAESPENLSCLCDLTAKWDVTSRTSKYPKHPHTVIFSYRSEGILTMEYFTYNM